MKKIIAAVYISLMLMSASYAEEKKQQTETEASNKEETTNSQKANKRNQVDTLEEFVPSEEVSADKPVAFPADI